ncbi:hypothetical protein BBO_06226 [Beauveria brongniartii RCEF 3172]|uniref:Siderophore biosynthesis enzyme n=1 Tax=Beauveria brongniartii RCEF 3172 TaxID=1081107 RepID=A0A162J6N2_9HYPO|nr:hypothetical protein BBO_06226 [Beauveria brongniartii RCEF 3172]
MTLIRTFAVVVVALSLASSALARTDLAGCTYTDLVVKPTQMAAYASRLWYVPDTGEVCEFLDCGGGRAPPKSTVPGCPLYTGTETYAPSYINPKTLGNGAVEAGSSSSIVAAATTTPVLATPSETASESAASATASASESASASASAAAATTASATTTDASITIPTGANTSTPSKSAESSSAQATSAASTAGASSSSAAASSKTAASGSNSGAATTTSPSSAAGAMQTVGAVLGPCVVAAIAAGLA